MGSVPRFETTSAAVYGRFVFAKRGLYKGGHAIWRDEEKIKQSNEPSTSALPQRPQHGMQFSRST